MIALLLVLLVAPMLALIVVAWVVAPAGALAATTPVLGLIVLTTLAPLPLVALLRLHQRRLDRFWLAGLPHSAAEWLRRRLAERGLDAVEVVNNGWRGSAFYPVANAIGLREPVYAEHTLRAWSVAAHELGHAILHRSMPRLSRLLLACRSWIGEVWMLSLATLMASVLVGAPAFRGAALVGLIAAAALTVAVLIDEIDATRRALATLRADPELPDGAVGSAAVSLGLALATYVVAFAVRALPLLGWSWLVARLGEGVLDPGSPGGPGGAWSSAGAALLVAGAGSAALVGALDERMPRLLKIPAYLTLLVSFFTAPAVVLGVAGHEVALAHPGALTLAAVSAFELVWLPVLVPLALLAYFAGRGLDLIAPTTRFVDASQLASLGQARRDRGGRSKLEADDDTDTAPGRLWRWKGLLFCLPLALYVLGYLGG